MIQLIVLDSMDPVQGWYFSGTKAGPEQDPLYGFKYMRELYYKADPNYTGRITVPLLWDKVKGQFSFGYVWKPADRIQQRLS